jgi:DNA-binding NtrC family response regulator
MVRELQSSHDFEAAGRAVLRTALNLCQSLLQESPWSQSGQINLAMLHLRPSNGYRGLLGLRPGQDLLETPDTNNDLISSATIWRWLNTHRCALNIDATLHTLQPVNGPVEELPVPTQHDAGGDPAWTSQESIQLYLGRDITHIHVTPLFSTNDELVGMLTLEARCQAAMGLPFIWEDCTEVLGLLTNIATPYLVERQPRPVQDDPSDERMPVVGRQMRNTMAMLRAFSSQREPLLLTGQTGTGKSRMARWCHDHSPYKGGPFEVLDLLSVPEDLQIAHIVGWRRGAFTGAVSDHNGALVRAAGGTLFIDEVNLLSPRAQAGLLTLLEDGEFLPLGGGRRCRVQSRIMAATNTDLYRAVQQGQFREDLYYRLNVLPMHLPPLSQRQDEIVPWANYMTRRAASGEHTASLHPDTHAMLTSQAWPGNLRQLDNILRRAYALALAEKLRSDEGPGHVQLGHSHIQTALGAEQSARHNLTLEQHLIAAAEILVNQTLMRQERNMEPLEIPNQVLRAYCLRQCQERFDDLREAFLAFGLESTVRNRNHSRDYQNMQQLIENLHKQLLDKE